MGYCCKQPDSLAASSVTVWRSCIAWRQLAVPWLHRLPFAFGIAAPTCSVVDMIDKKEVMVDTMAALLADLSSLCY